MITSQNTALTLAANQLDQTITGQHAIITVFADTIANVEQQFMARVLANTAMTAGGTSTLTLDRALPATTYNSYRMYALSIAGNVVWRRYAVTNPSIAAAMQQFFPYPFAFRNSDGTAATLTTSPVCTVYWSANGLPPYNQSSIGVQIDPVNGLITTVSPTSLVYGGGVPTPPTDIQVFLPVANGSLEVQAPSGGGYAGTLYTVEGIQRTKTVTVREWRDYSLTTNMQTYANELFSAISNVVVEGTIGYLGLATNYLTPGQAVSITGTSYTTGYESLALPVASIDVQFNAGPDGPSYVSTLHLSNRQARYTGDIFIRPAITGQQLGLASSVAYTAAGRRTTRMNGGLNRLDQLEARFERLRLDLQDTQAQAYPGAATDPGWAGKVRCTRRGHRHCVRGSHRQRRHPRGVVDSSRRDARECIGALRVPDLRGLIQPGQHLGHGL